MKKLLKNRKGMIALITVLILMSVGTLGIGMVITSQLSSSAANNYRSKIQTFNVADGIMTLVAQDILDSNESSYHIGGTSPILVEAETCTLSHNSPYNYAVESNAVGSGGKLIKGSTSGKTDTAKFFFSGATGTYNVNETYFDESDGASTYKVFINNNQVDTWVANQNTSGSSNADATTKKVRTISSVSITNGNQVRIEGTPESSEWARVDCIEFVPIQTFLDTVKVGSDSVPVIYSITQLGSNLFNMSTDAFKFMGTNQGRNYETHLTQVLSRVAKGHWVETAHDSALIPVTLYDFRANSSCPEFQVPGQTRKNMVRDTLDADRKPIPRIPPAEPNFRSCALQTYTGVGSSCFGPDWYTIDLTTRKNRLYTIGFNYQCMKSCTSNYHPNSSFGWWFNDSMHTWFRPHGDAGAGGAYTFDPISGQWTGLKQRPKYKSGAGFTDSVANEWVTTNWDSANKFANIVMYDTLKFRQQKTGDTTLFTFGDQSWVYKQDSIWFVKDCNVSQVINYPPSYTHNFPPGEYKFMPLKNRGFGYDASLFFSGNYPCVYKCNFSFTMEIHRKFTYKPDQTFFFRGDDDVWVFIDNHLVIDLGGTHAVDSQRVNLDTIHPALVSGQKYWFDFFYCERCVGTSNIYISTNMLLFVPPQPTQRSWKRDYGNID